MDGVGPKELGQWYSAWGAALVLFARQWVGDAAEDVVQEVFIRLMAQRRTPRQVRAWLFHAVRNAAISRLRSRLRRKRREHQRAADQPGWFDPQPQEVIESDSVQRALELLPVEQREIIVMRIWGSLTLQESADATGQPLSTLFSRYRAGLAALRERLGSECHRTS